jgi:trans-aconitate 2-methyltransferase
VTKSDWDPAQYERFGDERAKPFHDLLALCSQVRSGRVVDLGCGTGALTATIRAAEVLGLDTSESMLAMAQQYATDRLRFLYGDLATFHDASAWDLVISNAALQWVPDHPAVLARWADSLKPDGQLAVQVPANADHPANRAIETVALSMALPEEVAVDPVAVNVLAPERYAEILYELGLTGHVVRLEVYGPVLQHSLDTLEWLKGSTVTRVAAALADEPERFAEFLDRAKAEILRTVGDRSPYLFTFKRILMWGRRP